MIHLLPAIGSAIMGFVVMPKAFNELVSAVTNNAEWQENLKNNFENFKGKMTKENFDTIKELIEKKEWKSAIKEMRSALPKMSANQMREIVTTVNGVGATEVDAVRNAVLLDPEMHTKPVITANGKQYLVLDNLAQSDDIAHTRFLQAVEGKISGSAGPGNITAEQTAAYRQAMSDATHVVELPRANSSAPQQFVEVLDISKLPPDMAKAGAAVLEQHGINYKLGENVAAAAETGTASAKAAPNAYVGQGRLGKYLTADAEAVHLMPGFDLARTRQSIANTPIARGLVGEGFLGKVGDSALASTGKVLGFTAVAKSLKHVGLALINSMPVVGDAESAQQHWDAAKGYGLNAGIFVGMKTFMGKAAHAIAEGFEIAPKALFGLGKFIAPLGKGLKVVTLGAKSIPGVAAAATLISTPIELLLATFTGPDIGALPRLGKVVNTLGANVVEFFAGGLGGVAGQFARQGYVEGSKKLFGDSTAPMDSALFFAGKEVASLFSKDDVLPAHGASPYMVKSHRDQMAKVEFQHIEGVPSIPGAIAHSAGNVLTAIGNHIPTPGGALRPMPIRVG